MALTYLDRSDLESGMLASATAWQTLVSNHDEYYSGHKVTVLDQPVYLPHDYTTYSTATTDRLRFRLRGNVDLNPVYIRVRGIASSGSIGVRVIIGSQSTTLTFSSGSIETQTATRTPTDSGTVDCQLQTYCSSSGDEGIIYAVEVYYLAPAASTLSAAQTSGWTPATSRLYASGEPVTSERVERLLNGPRYIAGDRPWLAFSHVADEQTAYGSKSPQNWSMTSSTSYEPVGYFGLLVPAQPARTYQVDLYMDQSGSGAEWTVSLAGQTFTGSASGWQTFTLELPRSPRWMQVAGLAGLLPGSGNSASIRSLQIWRAE